MSRAAQTVPGVDPTSRKTSSRATTCSPVAGRRRTTTARPPSVKICQVTNTCHAEGHAVKAVGSGVRVHADISVITRSCGQIASKDVVSSKKGSRAGPPTYVEGLGRLVLVDSGASVEMFPFPDAWNGTPPARANQILVNMAVGGHEAWRIGDKIYIPPGSGPFEYLFPLGLFMKKWGLKLTDCEYGKGAI